MLLAFRGQCKRSRLRPWWLRLPWDVAQVCHSLPLWSWRHSILLEWCETLHGTFPVSHYSFAKLWRRVGGGVVCVCIFVSDALLAFDKHQVIFMLREGIVFFLVIKMFSLHINWSTVVFSICMFLVLPPDPLPAVLVFVLLLWKCYMYIHTYIYSLNSEVLQVVFICNTQSLSIYKILQLRRPLLQIPLPKVASQVQSRAASCLDGHCMAAAQPFRIPAGSLSNTTQYKEINNQTEPATYFCWACCQQLPPQQLQPECNFAVQSMCSVDRTVRAWRCNVTTSSQSRT